MNGELAQALALVAHGNAALAGLVDVSSFEAENTTCQYVRSLSLEVPDRRRSRTVDSVAEWVRAIAKWKVTRLSLLAGGDKPVAFANQGGWGLVGHARGRVCAWYPAWEVNRVAAEHGGGDHAIWDVTYGAYARKGAVEFTAGDLRARQEELVAAVTAAADFAREESSQLGFFVDWFDEVLEMTTSNSPVAPYHPDVLPEVGYDLAARRLVAMATRAWVFGGMGSWNDIRYSDTSTRQHYERISAKLFESVVGSLRDAANAFSVRGG